MKYSGGISAKIVMLAALAMLGARPGRAEDASALIAQAETAYTKREDVPQAKIALTLYERAAMMASTRTVECYWKASRAAWWLGEHGSDRKERLDLYHKAVDLAQNAVQADPNSAAAHFWLGGAMGSYGDAKGVMKSLSMVKPIRREMQEVLRIDERFDHGGAWQVLGVVDYKVPGLMGGSKKRAKMELDKAMAIGPRDPFNHYYLAEYYDTVGDKAKRDAEVQSLRTLSVEPDDVPELHMLQERAAKELQ